jgi:hypothetical protein
MRLFFQPANKSAGHRQNLVKVVYPKEQKQPVAWLGMLGTCQRRMSVRTPRVETEQHRAIRVEKLPEIIMGGSLLW